MTTFPKELTTGYGKSTTMYKLVADEVLVKTKPDTDEVAFSRFLSTGPFKDEKAKEPNYKRRAKETLDSLGYRWVNMKKKNNSFSAAQKELEKSDEIEEVRPIYYIADGGPETAATPLFDSVAVKLADNADIPKILEEFQALGYSYHQAMSDLLAPLHYLNLGGNLSLDEALLLNEKALTLEGVEVIEFDWLKLETYSAVPNDSEYANQWNMPIISAEEAWDIETGDPTIIIAIIDSGFDLAHPDLEFTPNTVANPTHFNADEFLDGDLPPYDASSAGVSHGTSCAGISAATINNNRGVVGLAGGCRIMPVRLGTEPTTNRVAAGLNWARNNGASVASLSLGTSVSMATTNAVVDAWNAGMVICAASGNDGGDTTSPAVNYPANHANVIAVGASNEDEERKRPGSSDGENWWGSQYGDELDVVAPGVHIWTTDEQGASGYNPDLGPAGDYVPDFNGTSSATPLVAGLAGLILSSNPSLTNQEVRDIIESTADKVSPALYAYANTAGRLNGTWHEEVGYGRVNALAAICAAVEDITLTTASVVFNDIPAGETAIRAASFSVQTCGNIDLHITAGPTVISGAPGSNFLPFSGVTSVAVTSSPASPATVQLWIAYTGTSAGDSATGSMTVHCPQTGDSWDIDLTANTIQRNSAAVMMVLDQSGSMEFDAGDGRDRIDVLRDSAPVLPGLLHDDDAIGIVAFDHDAYDRMPVTDVMAGGKIAAFSEIGSHTPNPMGATSIGDGLVLAGNNLSAVDSVDYPTKAIVVLTDGRENAPLTIAAASGSVNSRVYAIGLGTPEHIDPDSLTAITNGSGGYVLMTGTLSGDEYFTLQKYYLQILAGVTNADIVLDPEGLIPQEKELVIPFELADVDYGVDVILLTPAPYATYFMLVTPSGDLIEPVDAVAMGGSYVEEKRFAYYRLPLPLPIGAGGHSGKWQAILKINHSGFKKYLESLRGNSKEIEIAMAHGLRYSLSVQARSNLNFRGSLSQKDPRPGTEVRLSGSVTEYGKPLMDRTRVVAEILYPNKKRRQLDMKEVGPGQFGVEFTANNHGIYKCSLFAKGKTSAGRRFSREQILTASVYNPDRLAPDEDPIDEIKPDNKCVKNLETLAKSLSERSLAAMYMQRRLRQLGVSGKDVLVCLKKAVELMRGKGVKWGYDSEFLPEVDNENESLADLLRKVAAELENKTD